MTAFEQSVDRTVVVLARQLEGGTLTRAWEFDLARWLELSTRPSLVELIRLWNHLVGGTKQFPDGVGPWGAHPVWGEETYGIGHTRNCLRVFCPATRSMSASN